ncbi:hypothetical protein Rhom172_1652 [Rhodothermus marinus SG0.5JP17-172]|nr:hypothetical protein Rhom172_1652 [Rhodothermus marinus SG0.5JP17-172]
MARHSGGLPNLVRFTGWQLMGYIFSEEAHRPENSAKAV